MTDDYIYYMEILKSGGYAELEELSELDENFPHGKDQVIGIRWITNAIDCGCLNAVKWMLGKKVDIMFRSNDGYTVLHSAIDLDSEDKYEILEILLKAGADVNLKGINDWTPAHAAAARNDVTALKLLVKYGADLSIRTEIDEYATPLEEARILNKNSGCADAVNYLESLT